MDKFIIFDLDGTLVNTLDGITKTVKKFVKISKYNYSYTKKDVKSFIGSGVEILYKRVTKKDNIDQKELDLFMNLYSKYQKKSRLYKGVKKTINILNNRGYKCFLFSNKPDNLVKELSKTIFKGVKIYAYQGQDLNYPPKPDSSLLTKSILDKYKLDSKYGYYCGDTNIDLMTANNATLKPILCLYGYGYYDNINSDCIKISKFKDLLKILK